MEEGKVGAGSTHHFALCVDSDEELEGWREYLTCQGVACTEVMDRTYFKSIYLRDPDDHIVEIATRGPGFAVDEPAGALGSKLVTPSLDLGHRGRELSLGPGLDRSLLLPRVERRGNRETLALCEGPDALVLGDAQREQQAPATLEAPAALAHQQF